MLLMEPASSEKPLRAQDNVVTNDEMGQKTYEDGIREGRIRGIEETVTHHGRRLDNVESRMTAQERITYALLGAIALIEILPTIQGVVGVGG